MQAPTRIHARCSTAMGAVYYMWSNRKKSPDPRRSRRGRGCQRCPSLHTVFRPLSCASWRALSGKPLLIALLYGTAAVLGAAFALIELRMLYRFLRNRAAIRAEPLDVHQLDRTSLQQQEAVHPTVTIQIPLYNERTTAAQIVRAAAAQEYPPDRFDIQVLDDSTDETREIVRAVTEEVRGMGIRIEHITREDRTGYKAGALSEGLKRSEAEFAALFDADFLPEPSFLRRVMIEGRPFDDLEVAFVQTRWAWGDGVQGLLPAALSLLLDRHFSIQKPTRAFVGNVTTFNGSAGIWRRRAIEEAGGWTSDTLTEDLDLSYRCALHGWTGRYLQHVRVANELPGHMRSFKMQQRRWAQGNAQCFRKLTRSVIGSRGIVRDRLDEAFMLAGYAIHPLLLMSLVLWPWAVLYVDRTLFWILQGLMSLGMIAALLSFLVTVRERDARFSIRSVGQVLFGMGVGMGLMVNNTVGQIQGFLRQGGEFVRTPKGGTTSRTAARPVDARTVTLASRAYATPLHWTFFAELLVMGYSLAGAAFLIQAGEGFWAVPMVMWALCLGLMVQQQILVPRPA